MNDVAAPTILIVPGLRDHVPAHWQTFLEQKLANANGATVRRNWNLRTPTASRRWAN